MLHLAADENFNNDLLPGIRRRNPDVDVVRVQDAGLSGSDDATVLDWAAGERRVLLTHDVTTFYTPRISEWSLGWQCLAFSLYRGLRLPPR